MRAMKQREKVRELIVVAFVFIAAFILISGCVQENKGAVKNNNQSINNPANSNSETVNVNLDINESELNDSVNISALDEIDFDLNI